MSEPDTTIADTATIRAFATQEWEDGWGGIAPDDFDRWLAAHDAEVAAIAVGQYMALQPKPKPFSGSQGYQEGVFYD